MAVDLVLDGVVHHVRVEGQAEVHVIVGNVEGEAVVADTVGLLDAVGVEVHLVVAHHVHMGAHVIGLAAAGGADARIHVHAHHALALRFDIHRHLHVAVLAVVAGAGDVHLHGHAALALAGELVGEAHLGLLGVAVLDAVDADLHRGDLDGLRVFPVLSLGGHGMDHVAHVQGHHAVHDVDLAVVGQLLFHVHGQGEAGLFKQVLEAGQLVQAALHGHHGIQLEDHIVVVLQRVVGGVDRVRQLGQLVGFDGVAVGGQRDFLAVDRLGDGRALAAVDDLGKGGVGLLLHLLDEVGVLHSLDQAGVGGKELLGDEGHQLGILALGHLALQALDHLVRLVGQVVQRLGAHVHGHVALLKQGGDAAFLAHAQLDGEQRLLVRLHAHVAHGLLAVGVSAQPQRRLQVHALVVECKVHVVDHQRPRGFRGLTLAADAAEHHGEADQDRKDIHGHLHFLLLSLCGRPARDLVRSHITTNAAQRQRILPEKRKNGHQMSFSAHQSASAAILGRAPAREGCGPR